MRDVLSTAEAANLLKIKRSALTKRIQRGSIKATKIGWEWLIPRTEIHRVLAKKVHNDNR